MAKICIACGGTGGHLFPGLAVAEELERRGHSVRIYVSNKPVDAQVMRQYPKFETAKLPVTGWPGLSLRLPKFVWGFVNSYLRCLGDMKRYAPAAVIGMGGFLSAPPLLSAVQKNIPAYLHESNSIPGKVTRWLAPKVTKVFVGFQECLIPQASIEFTGTPVRTSLKRVDKGAAARALGMDAERKTLLVVGGSQGAEGLNSMMIQAARYLSLDWKRWQVIHLTGEKDGERVKEAYTQLGVNAKTLPFCDEMAEVYSLADLVVSRSGAASMTEIAMYGLASILVPFPHAADDHQAQNADIFVKAGAAKCVDERKASLTDFTRELHRLMQNEEARHQMANAAMRMFEENAVKKIVEEVEDAIA